MKTILSITVAFAIPLLLFGCGDQAPSNDTDSVLFNPDSPATVPQLFLPRSNSGSQGPQVAWREYQLGTETYRAKFTYREDAYMVDQFDAKAPRRYMAGVQVFSVVGSVDGPVLTAVGDEFHGFYVKNQAGFWAAFVPIDKPGDALKAMLKRAQSSSGAAP
jgi:hypothetical protein